MMKPRSAAEINAAINDLQQQRKEYMAAALKGNTNVVPSIQFIDNILKEMLPGYEPDYKGFFSK